MAITVNNANLLFKDPSGNVGKVKNFTDSDITKISNAISTVGTHTTQIADLSSKVSTNTTNIAGNTTAINDLSTRVGKIVDSSGNLAKATTSAYGTVILASSADITAGTAGKVVTADQLSSIKPASNCVTIDGAQTVTGAKTFSGATKVPTLGSSDSSTGAASTACVDSKITAQAVKLTGNQTVAGTKTFSAVTKSATPSASSNTTEVATTAWVITHERSHWQNVATMHNNIYRGANLLSGHFSSISAVISAISSGNFDDIYVGDYIPASYTYNGSTQSTNFRIAGINTLNARISPWGTQSPNVCIVPDSLGTSYMNSTNTTAGGYVGSYMYTTKLPGLYSAIAGSSGSPFYGHLITTTERLSNSIDTSKAVSGYSGWTGAVNGASDYTNQNLTLMNEVEVYGCKHWSSSEWDDESMCVQLPMFRLKPEIITLNGSQWFWLRSVCGSTGFRVSSTELDAYCNGASGVTTVRPRFFIG